VCNQNTRLNSFLDSLRQSATDQSGADFVLDVRSIHVNLRETWTRAAYQQIFTMETLQSVPPDIILRIMTKLLRNSLESIKPYVLTTMSDECRAACFRGLSAIPVDLSRACRYEYCEDSHFNYVYAQLHIDDGVTDVRFIT